MMLEIAARMGQVDPGAGREQRCKCLWRCSLSPGPCADAKEAPRTSFSHDPHDAEERPRHRHHDARRHRGGLGLAIDRDDAPEETGKLIGQRASVGALGVEPIGDGEIDLENAELKHVTRHCPVDVNGPGQDVPTGTSVSDVAADSADIFGHGTRRDDARGVNFLWIGTAHGLDDDDVAGIDGQHRLER